MLKKTLLGASIAAFASSASALELNGFGDTKFEVNVDVGAYYASVTDATGDEDNNLTGKKLNQVEFKGSRKLENGLKLFGEIEMDFDPVKNDDGVKTDDIKIGLSGDSGKLTIGQFDSFAEDKVFEALGVGHGEYGFVSEPKTGNDARHVQLYTKMDKVELALDITHSNEDGTNGDDLGYAFTAVTKLGSAKVGLSHDAISDFDEDGDTQSKESSTGLSVSLPMGDTDVSVLFAKTAMVDSSAEDITYTGLALSHDINEWNLSAAFQRVDDGVDARSEMMLGASYEVADDFIVYGDMVRLGNDKDEDDAVEVGIAYSF